MLGGIFVGGASSRMGGGAKGLLRAPSGDTIVEHLARAMRDAGLEPVLVGERAEYASLALRAIPDAVPDAGPLGGLVSLLEVARGECVVAVACDMPYVDASVLKKLKGAPDAPIVAPRRNGKWEPLLARYCSARVLSAAKARCASGKRALQGLLDEVGAVPLSMDPSEAASLVDWDTPDEVAAQNPTLASATSPVSITAFERGEGRAREDRVAVEEPLEIRCGRQAIAVTMRTPGADVDLAAGFLLGEGIVRAREEIAAIAPAGPHAVTVDLAEAARARLPRAERNFFATSSCGVCGKASLDRIRAELPPAPAEAELAPEAIARMPEMLRAAQSIFDRTGGLHAAGLFRVSPELELVRYAEDVGRHNAVDKVLGAELLGGHVPLAGHVLFLSGRIAFELVQKAALAGVSAIVAIGAPTSLAVDLARSAGLALVGFARGERFNVYCGRIMKVTP